MQLRLADHEAAARDVTASQRQRLGHPPPMTLYVGYPLTLRPDYSTVRSMLLPSPAVPGSTWAETA